MAASRHMTPELELLVEEHDSVLLLRLNRPLARNALNQALSEAVVQALQRASESASVRAVVLAGSGSVFCAGADLKERLGSGGDEAKLREPVVRLFAALAAFDKSLVFAIEGDAIGGGFELVLHADAAIAASSARFWLPELEWCAIPAGWGTQILPRLLGPMRARWLILSGTKLGAAEALEQRLITEVAEPGRALERALAVAQRLALLPPEAVAAAKKAVRIALERPLAEGVALERELLQEVVRSPERARRLIAFAARST